MRPGNRDRRADVDDDEALHELGMVRGDVVGGAAPHRDADEARSLPSERPHQPQHVVLVVVHAVLAGCPHALAVSSGVERDHPGTGW